MEGFCLFRTWLNRQTSTGGVFPAQSPSEAETVGGCELRVQLEDSELPVLTVTAVHSFWAHVNTVCKQVSAPEHSYYHCTYDT